MHPATSPNAAHRNPITFTRLIVGAYGLLILATYAVAALPPGAEEELAARAPEKLHIRITAVQKTGERDGVLSLVYTATVTKVLASAHGLKPGDVVTIRSYHWTTDDWAGPSNPPLLEKGWTGRAFLRPVHPDGDPKLLTLAAHGSSFQK